LDAGLQSAHQCADELAASTETPSLQNALALAQHLLGRLRKGWYASGLWSADALTAADAAEVEAIEDELFFRLRSIERAALLRAGTALAADDMAHMQRLCASLGAVGR